MSAVISRAAAARDRYPTVRGLRLHLREAGDAAAPAVLVLHGIMGHAREWDTLTDALAEDLHVLAVDQRGHGESDRGSAYTLAELAADLAALIRVLGLPRAHVVGHSLGAMAAARCAAEHPELVDRLVLIELPPDVPGTPDARELAAWITGLATVTYPDAGQAVDEWLAGNPLADPAHLRHYV
jgi:pimeloyl-ACP methyl ester carboxylesterase